jgi:transcription-repair coupling factor (superfamily II helicase)
LYAKRRLDKGFSLHPIYLQNELESLFIYEDTRSNEIYAEVVPESDRPMDRLVCGDVGFGKQLAIRAAFKAVIIVNKSQS